VKVCFETFGCRLNRAEALEMEAHFLARGWTRTERHDDADMIVVRGCSVTSRAERDCVRLVEHIRRKYPLKRIVVTGCMREKRNEQWLKSLTNDNAPVPTRTARAYLKVQDGCSGLCSFCTVPKFRGKAVSVPLAEVLGKARRFEDAGYGEIVVAGCSLTQYADGAKRLPDLVAELADAVPECRIRLGSIEPVSMAKEVVRAMAEHGNVCRFLHVPVQSGSTRILAAMRRPYIAKDVDALVREAVSLMPGLGLGCDLMSGFPDETDNDHLATLALLNRLPFTNAHVFAYSERPGTVAASLPNPVPKEIRSERAHELSSTARTKRSLYAKRFKGREVKIVVEDEKTLSGWTSEYLWCQVGKDKAGVLDRIRRIHKEGTLRKTLLPVTIREVRGDILTGDPA